MLKQDYISKILDLEDVIITKVENCSDSLHFYIEKPAREHICPVCGHSTASIHDYREQIIKDIPCTLPSNYNKISCSSHYRFSKITIVQRDRIPVQPLEHNCFIVLKEI